MTALYFACLLPFALASPTDCYLPDVPITDSLAVEIRVDHQDYAGEFLTYDVTGDTFQVYLALPPFADTVDYIFDIKVRTKRPLADDWSCWSPIFSGRTALFCPEGDGNCDGLVNLADLGLFALAQKQGGESYFDFDGNGLVNVNDLALWTGFQAHPPRVLYPEVP